MALFKVDENLLKDEVKVIKGITFKVFRNTNKLFEQYNKQQTNMIFTNCFEYINKNNLNVKYNILYVEQSDKIYLFIYHIKKEELIAYNYESYIWMLNEHNIKLKIKFISQEEIFDNELDVKTGIEIVDAIYYIDGLCEMAGKRYAKLRQRRNNFQNKNENLGFRHYNDSDKSKVLNLYKIWRSDKVQNDMITDAKIFKKGLDSDYLEKFVLTKDTKVIGFASFYCVGEWLYMYSMKTMRDKEQLRNTNVYMVHCLWNYIKNKYQNITKINLGGMDNPGWEDDFKEQLKPDEYLVNYINAKIK